MALPSPKDSYTSYTDQLVYFSARLAADPKTAPLAKQVEDLITSLDDAFRAVLDARRAETRARALRDHRDERGDAEVRKFRRRISIADDAAFVVERLFPRGVGYTTAPRGRMQVDRLLQLQASTDELLASERLAAHPEFEELSQVLTQGRATLGELIAELELIVGAWEDQTLEVARARDVFDFRRSDGVARLGGVIGELRALLGGSSSAAYGYTAPARRRSDSGGDDEGDDEGDDDALAE